MRVIARIDALEKGQEEKRAGWSKELLARLSEDSISFTGPELDQLRHSLRALASVLEGTVVESDAERLRIRLMLSRAETLVREKLPRQASRADKVEYLNATPGLGLRPLGELVGDAWPDAS
jgi:hypothetical protein